jgi:dipeptidyl-peptidase-4
MQSLRILLVSAIAVLALPVAAGDESADPSILTLERIFVDREFELERFGPARWLTDGSGYTTVEDSEAVEDGQDIVQYDPQTSQREVKVSAKSLIPEDGEAPLEIEDYEWSEDGRSLLLFTNTERVWRRETRGDYWLLELEVDRLVKLGGERDASTMMFAELSPDGRRAAWVDWESKNIQIQDLTTLEVRQLTSDGSATIVNGTSDWVNEEEFGLRDGFSFSPDGKMIAYWQFDTAGVGEYLLINNTEQTYPRLTRIPYPKVGTTNSACRVGVVPTEGGETLWFEPPGDPRQHYIPHMAWAESSDEVVLQRLNRLQNTNQVLLGNVRTGELRTLLTDHDEAWLDVVAELHWLGKGEELLWLSDRGGWSQLWSASRSGGELRLVTAGEYDVLNVEHVDSQGIWVYFTASPDVPTSRYLYRARIDGKGEPERLTINPGPGSHSYQISPDGMWAFHSYSSHEHLPVTELVSLPEHRTHKVLEDNAEVAGKIAEISRTPVERFRVVIEEGVEVDGWCIKPPDFDPSRKYPLLVYVYGEPAGQTVRDSWGRSGKLWHLMLAQRGYVIVSLDNRGTPAPRGRAWRKSVYRQIGIQASVDQAAGVRALLASRAYLDPERVGVWGWSGGGSMTLNALFRYPKLYRMGMAIAFVSDQKVYDTVYQERYMGLPEDNPDGYRDGSPITHAKNLEGELLLVHGTADDNVHYQSFELLVNELIAHNKQFTMMSYPNRTHAIREGESTTRHLYELLTRFLLDHLPPGPRDRSDTG